MEVITGENYTSTMENGQSTERQSSIDKEPRTLNIHQLHFAREAAQSVVNTRSMEEALKVFTKGLAPVVNKAAGADINDSFSRTAGYGAGYEEDYDEFRNYNAGRDVVSAPF